MSDSDGTGHVGGLGQKDKDFGFAILLTLKNKLILMILEIERTQRIKER